jgi:hypothetical protein
MNIVYLLLKIILILLASQYVVGPILVFFLQKFPNKYHFKILDSKDFLSERSETFCLLHDEIQKHGFECIGSSELIHSNSSMYFSFYNNLDLKLVCTLSTAHSKPVNSTQIEFTQMYEDGLVLNVSNISLISVFPSNKRKLGYRFPEMNDIKQLLDTTKRLVDKNETIKKRVTFEPGAEISTIEAHLDEEVQTLIAKGWVSEKLVNDEHRLTIKGAALMTWKLCWPVKKVLERNEESIARNALNNA